MAGVELRIPTIIMLYGAYIKLAGSLSPAVSLPTIVPTSGSYSLDGSFAVLGHSQIFVLIIAVESVAGTFLGGCLLGLMPGAILPPAVDAMLLPCAVEIRRHAGP